MAGGTGRIWPLSARDLIAVQQRLGPAKPGSDEGGDAKTSAAGVRDRIAHHAQSL